MDVEKCIELHNRIVAHACSRLPPDRQPKIQRNWFTAHSIDPSSSVSLAQRMEDESDDPDSDLEVEFDDDLIAFLSGIDIVMPEEHQFLAFNPFLVGVPPPGRMIPDTWLGSLPEREDYILLYIGTGYDPGGLFYKLSTGQVCFMDNIFFEPDEMYFDELQVALEIYWDCVESEKFVIDVEFPGFGYVDGLKTQGWRLQEWTDLELKITLEAWHSLVDAITKRLPGQGKDDDPGAHQEEKHKELDAVLVSSEILEQYPAIPFFARAFLSRAKKPIFTSIAPQLDVPTEDFVKRIGAILQELHPDITITTPEHEMGGIPKFIFFPWRTPGLQFVSQSDRDRWVGFRGDAHTLDNRAGLYLTPDGVHTHSISLLLPYSIGSNGHVRMNDGTIMKPEDQGQDALYGHHSCGPFMYAHGTPLAAVLVNWCDLIEKGNWHVDENGVAGGEDVWKQADTEDKAEDYMTDWSCF